LRRRSRVGKRIGYHRKEVERGCDRKAVPGADPWAQKKGEKARVCVRKILRTLAIENGGKNQRPSSGGFLEVKGEGVLVGGVQGHRVKNAGEINTWD